ncbi:MAG TPA: dihydropteroate synthase [Flavobacteriales bacterium]|jgi:dihydropteroate synthase|nr:dihydropteroate synthase [Flavobacteriales bacterium]|tara:strand:- start:30885 stop:31721 length:837 start_codon:yes stop_codon:yes gene_type:complete
MKALNIKGKMLDLSTPKVMGILNITDDSFFDGGKYISKNKILERCDKMLMEGASIIDIGAQSSRPGSKSINSNLEKERLLTAITNVKHHFPDIIISVDTYNSSIAKSCIKNGADIINDISAGEKDKEMWAIVAESGVTYIMMHMKGNPENMQENPQYDNITNDIMVFFEKKIKNLKAKGNEQIIIDPGFGFGKTMEHNYEILNNLERFQEFGLPLLVGVSRKSMIYNLLDTTAQKALNGTTAINMIALLNGANILRVHDVKQAIECIKIVNFAKSYKK